MSRPTARSTTSWPPRSTAASACIFTVSPPAGARLTALALARDYRRAGLAVRAYAATSLALHLLNTLLVFVLLFRLSGRFAVGALAALWFGTHPMHVESVAWIAGRKDVLYGGFFLT